VRPETQFETLGKARVLGQVAFDVRFNVAPARLLQRPRWSEQARTGERPNHRRTAASGRVAAKRTVDGRLSASASRRGMPISPYSRALRQTIDEDDQVSGSDAVSASRAADPDERVLGRQVPDVDGDDRSVTVPGDADVLLDLDVNRAITAVLRQRSCIRGKPPGELIGERAAKSAG
jgi:hypothetical protein